MSRRREEAPSQSKLMRGLQWKHTFWAVVKQTIDPGLPSEGPISGSLALFGKEKWLVRMA